MDGTTFDPNTLFHAGVAGVVGVGLFWQGFGWLRTLRRIENTPTAKVRSLALGAVELSGAAESDEPLVAPLSGKPCVWYSVIVQELRSNGRHGSRWVVREAEQSSAPFHLRDDTGRILVMPDGADPHLPESFTARVPGMAVPATVEAYLDAQGLRRGIFGRTYRLTERNVGLGDTLYVLGVARERPDMRREKTERTNEKLRELRASSERMSEIDVDGDGEISDLEWDRARDLVRSEVEREGVEDRIVVARGDHGETFVFSDREEHELVAKLRWKAFGGVFGGGAIAVGALAWAIYSMGGL